MDSIFNIVLENHKNSVSDPGLVTKILKGPSTEDLEYIQAQIEKEGGSALEA